MCVLEKKVGVREGIQEEAITAHRGNKLDDAHTDKILLGLADIVGLITLSLAWGY